VLYLLKPGGDLAANPLRWTIGIREKRMFRLKSGEFSKENIELRVAHEWRRINVVRAIGAMEKRA
jgi:hypothetical protein